MSPADLDSPGVGDQHLPEPVCHNATDPGYMADKAKYLARIRRIEGQVRGVHRMVDEEQYCIDILTQIAALRSAMQSLAVELLGDHLSHCVADAMQSGGEDALAKIAEAKAAVARLAK